MCMCINDIFETIKGYTIQYVRGYILLTRTNDNSLGELSIRENMLMLFYNNYYNITQKHLQFTKGYLFMDECICYFSMCNVKHNRNTHCECSKWVLHKFMIKAPSAHPHT